MNIGGFEPLSLCDYPGIPASVVFTQGCNWRCPYCHNTSLLSFTVEPSFTETAVLEIITDRADFIEGVVITGGEPTEQVDLADFIQEIRKIGFKIKLDTNGSNPRRLEKLLADQLLDYVAMDIKAPLSKYDLVAGCSVQHSSIMDSISIVDTYNIEHHFRTTFSQKHLDESDLAEIKNALPSGSEYVVQKLVER